MTVGVSFSEEYDADIEGNKEKKYYDLLEFSQLRLVELAEETKKTLIVIKEQSALDKRELWPYIENMRFLVVQEELE